MSGLIDNLLPLTITYLHENCRIPFEKNKQHFATSLLRSPGNLIRRQPIPPQLVANSFFPVAASCLLVPSMTDSMSTSSFPNFARLPDEIKVMIWKQAAKAEAASRIVILHTCNIKMLPSSGNTPALSVMPLKRLISPLLMVCVQSRQVALRHYGTRVNVYERPSPMDWASHEGQPIGLWSMTEEAPSSVQSRFFHPLRVTEPVWADRECVTDGIDCWLEKGIDRDIMRGPVDSRVVGELEDDENDYEEYEADAAIQNMQTYRGCVYLDLASDRFLLLMSPNYCYGLREVSNALDDFKYGTSSASFHGIYETIREIVAHRPPVLRHTSVPLSDEVLMGIRHVVLP
ncbi:hypothetical protein PG995_002829 [Apiospora arundinis]